MTADRAKVLSAFDIKEKHLTGKTHGKSVKQNTFIHTNCQCLA